MKLHLNHTTIYDYSEPVPESLAQLRLTPTSGPTQTVIDWSISLDGASRQVEFTDHHGNPVVLIAGDPMAQRMVISIEGDVETADSHGVFGPHSGFAPLALFERSTPLTVAGAGVMDLVSGLEGTIGEDDVGRLHALAAKIAERVAYEGGATTSASSAEEAISAGTGVCQDHSHIFIAASRALGYPARYVSGYLMMNETINQAASHAWAEVHVAGLGWVGFDVSNGYSPDARYVRLATGLDYHDAAPFRGLRVGGGEESLDVSVAVLSDPNDSANPTSQNQTSDRGVEVGPPDVESGSAQSQQ